MDCEHKRLDTYGVFTVSLDLHSLKYDMGLLHRTA